MAAQPVPLKRQPLVAALAFLLIAARALARIATDAAVWLWLLLLVGFSLVVAGVLVLFGLGPALIAGGAACLMIAAFIMRGMRNV